MFKYSNIGPAIVGQSALIVTRADKKSQTCKIMFQNNFTMYSDFLDKTS